MGTSSSILDYVPSLVTHFDNVLLDKLPSLEEVKDVVFFLGRDSALGSDGLSGGFLLIVGVLSLRMSFKLFVISGQASLCSNLLPAPLLL